MGRRKKDPILDFLIGGSFKLAGAMIKAGGQAITSEIRQARRNQKKVEREVAKATLIAERAALKEMRENQKRLQICQKELERELVAAQRREIKEKKQLLKKGQMEVKAQKKEEIQNEQIFLKKGKDAYQKRLTQREFLIEKTLKSIFK